MPDRTFYEFGPFRLAASPPVLLRDDNLLDLTPKALELLVVLVRNSGSLVSKEELMKAAWPDTFVEEGNLTQNISLLRKALGSDADHTYIETMSKRGYRFAAPVRLVEASSATVVGTGVPAPGMRPRGRTALAIGAVLLLGILSISISWRVGWFAPKPELLQRQITANPSDDGVYRAAISPDGKYLAYTDLNGVYLRLIETGETRSLPIPAGLCFR